MTQTFENPEVEIVFDGFPQDARRGLLHLRHRIFARAVQNSEVSPLREELRWGQPAYLCKSGSTLRLAVAKHDLFALYAHCQTSIIRDFAELFPGEFSVEGNRAILFSSVREAEDPRLDLLIDHALTYHRK